MNDVIAIEVIEKETVGDRVIVAGQLKGGKVLRGMILKSDENGRYEVAGIGFVSPELHAKGRCALTLIPLDENGLAIGSTLHQANDTALPS